MRSRRSARRSTAASRTDPRVRLAVVLVLVGLALVALGVALRPVVVGEAGVIARMGPGVARYDAANDTTLATFPCGHAYCSPAYVLRGDATDEVAKPRVYLRADATDWTVVNVPPLSAPRMPSPVDVAYAGPFEPAAAGPRLLPLVVGPVVLAVGVGFALPRLGRTTPVWTTVAGAAGVALGVLGASAGEGGLFVTLGATALGLASLALLVSPRTRRAGVSLALAGAVAVFLSTQARGWFPVPPAL